MTPPPPTASPAVTAAPRPDLPVRPRTAVGVTVLAEDQIALEASTAVLSGRPEVVVVPGGGPRPDAVLVFTREVTDETLDRVDAARAAGGADGARPGAGPARTSLVLVTETMREQHLWRAAGQGLTSIVPRAAATWDRVVAALVSGRHGRGEIPPVAVGWLLDQIRTLQSDVLAPAGLTAAGLATREVEVLRLLADGLDTVEIAQALNYSERTIKNIIHGLISRLNLRNRSHAVAYALRCGAL